ncbi:hypothetical protein [Streptomyces himalayensis]|uniref:Uncharacterized protein n=1 Tax=Streptomyces himalayensis subsp. himalayensis TaxID=2756131 RepID=A0A7W0DVB5_9ACTN|nr:hypothetical protein [Streptomyces himalayensis]MBA2951971.1 hypothetical protein [Streptomyces himalayensis subsp. himalayensis]
MESDQILALYTWETGICFRCPARGTVDTTAVRKLHSQFGDTEVRACRLCVLAMEETRRRAAERAGIEYKPGHAGEVLA